MTWLRQKQTNLEVDNPLFLFNSWIYFTWFLQEILLYLGPKATSKQHEIKSQKMKPNKTFAGETSSVSDKGA